jgi:hypothetical protein
VSIQSTFSLRHPIDFSHFASDSIITSFFGQIIAKDNVLGVL